MNSRTPSWRAAYPRCRQVGVDRAALTRLGRGIEGGTPSAHWNAGQQTLAAFRLTLTGAPVDLYPPMRPGSRPWRPMSRRQHTDGPLVGDPGGGAGGV